MLKKLLVPFVVFAAAAAVGCSSSTPSTTGTGGTGGSTAGSGGSAAGSGGSTAGSGGSAAGSGGSAAGSGGSTAGTGGSTAGSGGTAAGGTDGGAAGATAGTDGGGTAGTDGGGADAPNVAALKLECPTKIAATNAATPFTPEEFCALYADVCAGQTFTGMLTSDDCIATYTAWATKKVTGDTTHGEQNCTSYHLCNANAGDPATHCKHAAGTAVCVPM